MQSKTPLFGVVFSRVLLAECSILPLVDSARGWLLFDQLPTMDPRLFIPYA